MSPFTGRGPLLWTVWCTPRIPSRTHLHRIDQAFFNSISPELGTRLFWVFALALSRSRRNPFALALLRSLLGLKFHAFAFSLLVFLRSYFRALNFLSRYWFSFRWTLPLRTIWEDRLFITGKGTERKQQCFENETFNHFSGIYWRCLPFKIK